MPFARSHSEPTRKQFVVDGRVNHSVLLEIFTDAGVGTEVVA